MKPLIQFSIITTKYIYVICIIHRKSYLIESNTTHRLSCPRPHTGDYFDIACADGSKCSWYKDGWDCCVGKGGKTNCPEQQPFLCSKPDACSDGKEFCCSPTEEGCESQNAGSVMCPGTC